MVARSELSPPARPAAPLSGWPALTGPTAPPRWPLAAVLGVVLFLLSPLTWDATSVPPWSPAAGLALALLAWFGRRFTFTVLGLSGVLLVLTQLARLEKGG